jgi:3',5'-cyclic AMP phosphodiesterase CpdA
MPHISFVHIGDIHYPVNSAIQQVDLKDKGLSPDFIASVAPSRMKSAMDSLVRVLEERNDVRALLFSGDLTSRSDLDGYDDCVEYLAANLSRMTIWKQDQLHVVHGNHDIDRSANTAHDALARYRPTQQSWTDRSMPILHADQVRSVEIREGKAGAWVHSVNSCVGCGESRRLPERVRVQIGALLQQLGASPISPADFDLIGEQLDTPAFDVAHVSEVTKRIACDRESVHVLLGHHPVLPQALPRIEIYTEAINGGLVRTALTELPIGVLYCHGHVHDDPIEIVRNAEVGNDVVCISAPLFIDGFNLLTFHFAPDRRSAGNASLCLGCEVTRYRAGRDSALKPDTPIRIPLCRADNFDYIADDLHRAILGELTNEPIRFRPLLLKTKAVHNGTQTPRFEEHLAQLHWFGLVAIAARDEEVDHWQIRRVGG